jgi:hypothetical protein
MKPTRGKIEEVLELLGETPDQIATITEGLSFDQLCRSLEEKSWSQAANINGKSHTVFSQARWMAFQEERLWDQFKSIKERIATLQQDP